MDAIEEEVNEMSPTSNGKEGSPKKGEFHDERSITSGDDASGVKIRSPFGSLASDIGALEDGGKGPEEKTYKLPTTDNFRILRVLGCGDVGNVFLVQSYGLEEGRNGLYAMKVISKADIVKRNKIPRIQTERQILATTSHPFLVHLYYAFQDEEHLYYIMQFCAGGELFRYMQKKPDQCMTEDEARFCTAEILIALEYLHCMGYIYRDLKPENVLVDESGHLVLTDFDLSKNQSYSEGPSMAPQKKGGFFGRNKKQMPSLDTESHLNCKFATSFVGTVEYIAPEVLSNEGYAGSVDWWTLGIFLYEMLFGKTPFKGADARDTFSKIRRYSTAVKKSAKKEELIGMELTFPDTPVVSKKAKDLIGKLLNKDNSKRLLNPTLIKADPWFKGLQWALLRCQSPPLKIEKIDAADIKSLFRFENGPVPPHLKWFNPDEDPATIGVATPPPADIPPVPTSKSSISESTDSTVAPQTSPHATTDWTDFDYIRLASDPSWERHPPSASHIEHPTSAT